MENEGEAGRFYILPLFKNVENEGKARRFYILLKFKKCGKGRCSDNILNFTSDPKNAENEGEPGRF